MHAGCGGSSLLGGGGCLIAWGGGALALLLGRAAAVELQENGPRLGRLLVSHAVLALPTVGQSTVCREVDSGCLKLAARGWDWIWRVED